MRNIQLVGFLFIYCEISIDKMFILAEIESNHLRACLCYVENALGSAKSDLSEDSIER
jgi:hypothetical protein